MSDINSYNKQIKRVTPFFEQDLTPAGTLLDSDKSVIQTIKDPIVDAGLTGNFYPFVLVTIEGDNAGLPDGVPIAEGFIDIDAPLGDIQEKMVKAWSTLPVFQANTTYWITVSDNNGGKLGAQSFLNDTEGKLDSLYIVVSTSAGFVWLNSAATDVLPNGTRANWGSGQWNIFNGDRHFTLIKRDVKPLEYLDFSGILDDYFINNSWDNFYGLPHVNANFTLPSLYNKTISTGMRYESWTNSDVVESPAWTGLTSRQHAVTSTISSDSYIFEEIDSNGQNRRDLGYFNHITNQVTGGKIKSDPSDALHYAIYIEDAQTLDLGNCKLLFYASDGQTNLSVDFTMSRTPVISNTWIELVFFKKDFVLSNPLNETFASDVEMWSFCSYKLVKQFKGGNQSVYTSHVTHKGDVQKHGERGLPVRIGSSVSEDDGATWFNTLAFTGRIDLADSATESLSLEAISLLDMAPKATLPTEREYGYEVDGEISDHYTPSSILGDMLSRFDGVGTITLPSFDPFYVRYAYIDNEIPVEQNLRELVNAGLLRVSIDPQNNIYISNPLEYFQTNTAKGYLDTKLYRSFKRVSDGEDRFYNKVTLKGAVQYKDKDSILFGNGKLVYNSRDVSIQVAPGTVVIHKVNKSDFSNQPLNNDTVMVQAYEVSSSANGGALSGNGDVFIDHVELRDGDVYITIRNASADDRFVTMLRLAAHVVAKGEEVNISEVNQASIDRYGVKELNIDSKFIQSYAFRYLALQVLAKHSFPTPVYELEMSYQPGIKLGDKYYIVNEFDKTVLCVVESIDTHFKNSGMVSLLTLKEEYIGDPFDLDNTRPFLSAGQDCLLNVSCNGFNPVYQSYKYDIPNNAWTDIRFTMPQGYHALDLNGISYRGATFNYSISNGLDVKQRQALGYPVAAGVMVPRGRYRIKYRVKFSQSVSGARQARFALYNGVANDPFDSGSRQHIIRTELPKIVNGSDTFLEGEFVWNNDTYDDLNLRLEILQTSGTVIQTSAKETWMYVVKIAEA